MLVAVCCAQEIDVGPDVDEVETQSKHEIIERNSAITSTPTQGEGRHKRQLKFLAGVLLGSWIVSAINRNHHRHQKCYDYYHRPRYCFF